MPWDSLTITHFSQCNCLFLTYMYYIYTPAAWCWCNCGCKKEIHTAYNKSWIRSIAKQRNEWYIPSRLEILHRMVVQNMGSNECRCNPWLLGENQDPRIVRFMTNFVFLFMLFHFRLQSTECHNTFLICTFILYSRARVKTITPILRFLFLISESAPRCTNGSTAPGP